MALDETQINKLKATGLNVSQTKSLQSGRSDLTIYTQSDYIDFTEEMAEILANLMQDTGLASIKFGSLGSMSKVRFQEGALAIFAKAVSNSKTLESIELSPSSYESPEVIKALEDAVCASENRNLNRITPFTESINQVVERNCYRAKTLLEKMYRLETLTKDDCVAIAEAFWAIQAEMQRQSDGYDFLDNAKLLFRVKSIAEANGIKFPELSHSQRYGVKEEAEGTDGLRSVTIGNRVYKGRSTEETYEDFIAANPQLFVRR